MVHIPAAVVKRYHASLIYEGYRNSLRDGNTNKTRYRKSRRCGRAERISRVSTLVVVFVCSILHTPWV